MVITAWWLRKLRRMVCWGLVEAEAIPFFKSRLQRAFPVQPGGRLVTDRRLSGAKAICSVCSTLRRGGMRECSIVLRATLPSYHADWGKGMRCRSGPGDNRSTEVNELCLLVSDKNDIIISK